MSVSVIIPCYNGERFVREAIESAMRQTLPPAQVIVVDDGSRDSTVAVAMRIPGATVIAQTNRGASLARNRGIAEARGEYLVFLDHDDRLLPEALEIGARALDEHAEAGFVYGFHKAIDPEGRPIPEPPIAPVAEASYRRTLEGDTLVPPGCAMFRRSLIESIGGFRDGTFPTEDYDLYLRAGRVAPIHCHNRFVVEYRVHPNNASAASSSRGLRAAHAALEAQREFVRGQPELERAIEIGKRHWGHIFGPGIAFEAVERLRRGQVARALDGFALALRWHPQGLADVARHYARRATGRGEAKRR